MNLACNLSKQSEVCVCVCVCVHACVHVHACMINLLPSARWICSDVVGWVVSTTTGEEEEEEEEEEKVAEKV